MLEQAKDVFVTYYCRVASLQAETLVPFDEGIFFCKSAQKLSRIIILSPCSSPNYELWNLNTACMNNTADSWCASFKGLSRCCTVELKRLQRVFPKSGFDRVSVWLDTKLQLSSQWISILFNSPPKLMTYLWQHSFAKSWSKHTIVYLIQRDCVCTLYKSLRRKQMLFIVVMELHTRVPARDSFFPGRAIQSYSAQLCCWVDCSRMPRQNLTIWF